MILHGSQRGGALDLAHHLQKEENEHIEVHEIRGFAADDLTGALRETKAIAKGTKCRQPLFSLSLNPPPSAKVRTETFLKAINDAEERLALNGQPRAVVFHEKNGRRHAHAVWSRIDAETMTAINLAFPKMKLRTLSRELLLHYGWNMPRGLRDPALKDPRNYSMAEFQQTLRNGRDPREIKTIFQECWARTDNAQSLSAALAERGFFLARGDRRAAVAIDIRGEVYAVGRWANVRAKAVRERLGPAEDLPSLNTVRDRLGRLVANRMRERFDRIEARQEQQFDSLKLRARAMAEAHRRHRAELNTKHEARWAEETGARAQKLRGGMGGLWDRLISRTAGVEKANEMQAWFALKRDREERDRLILSQLDQRQSLQNDICALRQKHAQERAVLSREMSQALKAHSRSLIDDWREAGRRPSDRHHDPPDRESAGARRSPTRDGPSLDR